MVRLRPATDADSRACFELFEETIDDLGRRTGVVANDTAGDPTAWTTRRPLFDHLAATFDAWWVAEDEDGHLLGYARSILRDGTRELTEFFVRPSAQASGIGRELLAKAFPAEGAAHRGIVATTDNRAIARYLRSGLDGRRPMVGFEAVPRPVTLETDLISEPLAATPATLEAIGELDRRLIGFRRDEDHRWLAEQRPGRLYRRAGTIVAYGYHPARPSWGGPFAAAEAADLPILLADAETAAAGTGQATITFDLALIARAGVDHLLGRGFRIDPFVMLYFSDVEPPGLDRYALTSPPFFL